MINRPKIFISIVRDPIAQTVSHFNYIKRRPRHLLYSDIESTLDETLTKNNSFRVRCQEIYCKILTNKLQAEKAIEVIENNPFIIGKLESIDLFIRKLNFLFGFTKKSFSRLNTAPSKHQLLLDSTIYSIKNIRQNDFELLEKIGDLYCNVEL